MFKKALTAVAVSAAALASSAFASSTTIDFEAFVDFQNLHGMDLGGVTITNPLGVVEIYDNRFGVGSNSGTKSIGSFASGARSVNPMIFTFDTAVNVVELYAGDGGGDQDSWSFEVFDAQVGGNSLGIVNSGSWVGNPYQALSHTVAGILRAEAVWTGSAAGIGFDDLTFRTGVTDPVPVPAAALLFAPAAFFAARRRKSA